MNLFLNQAYRGLVGGSVLSQRLQICSTATLLVRVGVYVLCIEHVVVIKYPSAQVVKSFHQLMRPLVTSCADKSSLALMDPVSVWGKGKTKDNKRLPLPPLSALACRLLATLQPFN